jgi:hypothetical protein
MLKGWRGRHWANLPLVVLTGNVCEKGLNDQNTLFIYVCIYLFVFWDRVSLGSPGWTWTCHSPASASQVLRLQVCIACSASNLFIFIWSFLYPLCPSFEIQEVRIVCVHGLMETTWQKKEERNSQSAFACNNSRHLEELKWQTKYLGGNTMIKGILLSYLHPKAETISWLYQTLLEVTFPISYP